MPSHSRPRWFAPSSIPPILLLTVVTSFAFNHALISTQRKADIRTHRIHTALLQDTIDYNSRLLFHLNPPSGGASSSSWFSWFRRSTASKPPSTNETEDWIAEEKAALQRRWKALGLSPRGLLASSNEQESISQPDLPSVVVGPKEVSWSEIFLGNRDTRSSLTQRWRKVTAGIKESFNQLNPQSPTSGQVEEQVSIRDEEELEQLSKMWSDLQKSS